MKIHFDKIRLRNFGSYGNKWTEYVFDEGLYNLYGAIGQGKSSILSALYFNLYGKTFNTKVNIGELVNTTNDSDLVTESYFRTGEDKYVVVRGLKPNILNIFKNGNLIDSLSKKKFVQEELDKILGMNSDMFKSVVGLSVQNNKAFFLMAKGEKRAMLENLFGLTLFANMGKEVKNEVTLLKTDIEVLKRTLSIYEQTLVESSNQIKSAEKISKESEESRNGELMALREQVETVRSNAKKCLESVSEIKDTIEKKKSEICNIQQKCQGLSSLRKRKKDLDSKRAVLDHNINNLRNTDVCPTCLTVVSDEHKAKHIKEFETSKLEIDFALNSLDKEIEVFEGLLARESELNNEIVKDDAQLRILNEQLKGYSRRSKELGSLIESKAKKELGVDIEEMRRNFDRKVSDYTTVKKTIAFKQEDVRIDDILVDILSDNGVKTYFMNKMLPWLNYKVNEYLDRFDFPAKITINSNLGEKIETLSGITRERSYGTFSGGERKIIDVSIWLAFIDSVKTFLNWNSNLLFVDELFDEGTDSETIEKIVHSLRNMSNEKNMHITIISHKNPEVRFDGKFHARKIGGFSNLEEMK